ncbi:MAG: hypothetical protein WBC97_09035 [Gemmatimonadales bacterium]
MTTAGLNRAFTALALLAVLAATPAAAQARSLRPAASQLFLPTSAPLRVVYTAPASRAPVRDSTSSNGALNGALLGAGIGGALGALVGAAACEDNCSFPERTRSTFGVLLIGATIGAVIGGIIGSL